MNTREEAMLQIIDSRLLSTYEIADLVFNFNEVSRCYNPKRMNYRQVDSIVEIGKRYFHITWDKGLTKNNRDNFFKQPYEILMNDTLDMYDWIPKKLYQQKNMFY